jgi:hypothetical protein
VGGTQFDNTPGNRHNTVMHSIALPLNDDPVAVSQPVMDAPAGGQAPRTNIGVLAAGDEPYVFNVFGDLPGTVIAPPLLFDELTVKCA